MPNKRRNQPDPPDLVDKLTSMQAAIDSLSQKVDEMNKQTSDDDEDDDHPDLVWDADLGAYVEDWGEEDEEEEVLQTGPVQ